MATGLSNCARCSKPCYRSGVLPLCERCLHQEAQLFQSYYQRLQRNFKKLDIVRTARHTGIDGRRLLDAVDYRLGMGRVFHLASWREGQCYVCREPQLNHGSREPVCLHCLETFFRAYKHDDHQEGPGSCQAPETSCTDTQEKVTSGCAHQPATTNVDEKRQNLWERFRGEHKPTPNDAHHQDDLSPTESTTQTDAELDTLRLQLLDYQKRLADAETELIRYQRHFGQLPTQMPLRLVASPPADLELDLDGQDLSGVMELLDMPDALTKLSGAEWAAIDAELTAKHKKAPKYGFRRR